MKAFILGVFAVAVVALLGAWVLSTQQRSSAALYTSESTRVGNPGENLLVERLSRRAQAEQGEKTSRE